MPTNVITWMEKINFLKGTICQNSHKKDDLNRPTSIKEMKSVSYQETVSNQEWCFFLQR